MDYLYLLWQNKPNYVCPVNSNHKHCNWPVHFYFPVLITHQNCSLCNAVTGKYIVLTNLQLFNTYSAVAVYDKIQRKFIFNWNTFHIPFNLINKYKFLMESFDTEADDKRGQQVFYNFICAQFWCDKILNKIQGSIQRS